MINCRMALRLSGLQYRDEFVGRISRSRRHPALHSRQDPFQWHIPLFHRRKNDQLKEPMFFGQPVNVARYDQQKYDIFEKLIEKQLSFFWRPEEVDVSRDRIDYQALPEHEKHIFISNLKYQTLLDSIQGAESERGLAAAHLHPGAWRRG
ncbi:ribonucleoside-diphosphate reductase 1 subunit beta [Salmonella bongori]|nr:ribonucleoside-diphosphate reductase 1 subunit beta [Salmonella bongori]